MEGPNLTQHEVIKFLTMKGGRCTNFELVSNFRGALNHPLHQAEARSLFKDIVNTVANVGEFQNTKYIELKREYYENNFQPSQPSSLSSDSGGSSYSSPLANQGFQPYWRYRLSTSTAVPALPVRSSNVYPAQNLPTQHSMGRSVSESTLPHEGYEIQPPPRTRGRSAGGYNRSVSENPSGSSPVPQYSRRSSYVNDDNSSRRSSVNGYVSLEYSHNYASSPVQFTDKSQHDVQRRNSAGFGQERVGRTHWPPLSDQPVPEFPSLTHSRSFSGSYAAENQYNSSNRLNSSNPEKDFSPRNSSVERSTKRTGVCSDEMLKELENDSPSEHVNNAVSRSFNWAHVVGTPDLAHASEGLQCSGTPDNSSTQSNQIGINSISSPRHGGTADSVIATATNHPQRVRPIDSDCKNRLPDSSPNLSRSVSPNRSISDYDTASLCSSNSGNGGSSNVSMRSGISWNPSQDTESVRNCNSGADSASPPVPPERRRRNNRPTAPNNVQSPDDKLVQELSSKVKDRVQHFDGLEKQQQSSARSQQKRGTSPLPGKENRIKANLSEDDVSISVLDPKLKREWFVKAAQGDYYALVGLLKKEPRLAAIKDIATFTALHWAAKHGDANIVKLIAGTYRVNTNLRSGYTAIHLATLYKHLIIVDLLVHTYGADASLRDYSGKRADQYPANYVRHVVGLKTLERRPLKARPAQKESGMASFMRIGSLNLRKSTRKSAVFASVRGSTRNWGSATELRLNSQKSARKKNSKNAQVDKKCDTDSKNDSDSDSAYGFYK